MREDKKIITLPADTDYDIIMKYLSEGYRIKYIPKNQDHESQSGENDSNIDEKDKSMESFGKGKEKDEPSFSSSFSDPIIEEPEDGLIVQEGVTKKSQNQINTEKLEDANKFAAFMGQESGRIMMEMSESVASMRQIVEEQNRSIEVMREENNQLRLRLENQNLPSIEFMMNSPERALLGATIVGVVSFFGYQYISNSSERPNYSLELFGHTVARWMLPKR